MPTKKDPRTRATSAKDKAEALGRAIRELREARGLSRAELLDRVYTELENDGIDYKVRGDWWLNGIENGEKAKQLPREYIDAFIRALGCTPLETVHLLMLADLNMLTGSPNPTYAAGLAFVLTEVFKNAIGVVEAQIDPATAARLDEREWLAVGKTVLELVIAEMEDQLKERTR